MNQITSLHICILLCICSSQICQCTDQRYINCAPIHCGHIPNISYPFHIQNWQPSYCGQPGFNLTCTNNTLLLNISSNTFQVQQIFYHNRSLRVSDTGFLNIAQTCTPPHRNLILRGIRFNFTTSTKHKVSLYSDCPTNSSFLHQNINSLKVNCSSSKPHKGSIFGVIGGNPKVGKEPNRCKKVVWTRVEGNVNVGDGVDKWKVYEDAVRRGFVMKWKATNCSKCRLSGGRCGFDEKDYRFLCYCMDRAQAFACPAASALDVRRLLKRRVQLLDNLWEYLLSRVVLGMSYITGGPSEFCCV